MAAGLPVIASAVGELPNTILAGAGVIVPPGDAAALAAAIEQLVSRPESLAAFGAAARARVLNRFGPERYEAAGLAVVARLKALL